MPDFNFSSELFAALIGVILTMIITTFGWFYRSTHESKEWERKERYEAYLKIGSEINLIPSIYKQLSKLVIELRKLRGEINNIQKDGPLDLLDENRKELDKVRKKFADARNEMKKYQERGNEHIAKINAITFTVDVLASDETQKIIKRHNKLCRKLNSSLGSLSSTSDEHHKFIRELYDLKNELTHSMRQELLYTSFWKGKIISTTRAVWVWLNTDVREMRNWVSECPSCARTNHKTHVLEDSSRIHSESNSSTASHA